MIINQPKHFLLARRLFVLVFVLSGLAFFVLCVLVWNIDPSIKIAFLMSGLSLFVASVYMIKTKLVIEMNNKEIVVIDVFGKKENILWESMINILHIKYTVFFKTYTYGYKLSTKNIRAFLDINKDGNGAYVDKSQFTEIAKIINDNVKKYKIKFKQTTRGGNSF